jgi:antitoxin component YwqK of YwqJK toxin-antitoxin module
MCATKLVLRVAGVMILLLMGLNTRADESADASHTPTLASPQAAADTEGNVPETPAPSTKDDAPAPSTKDDAPAPSTKDEAPAPSAKDESPAPPAKDETMAPSADHAARSVAPAPAPAPSATSDADGELVTERYPDGSVKIERQVTKDAAGNYVNHGTYTAYAPDGTVQKTGVFQNGKLQGKWTQSFAKDEGHLFAADHDTEFQGPFVSEATFVDGQLDGTWTIKDRNGQNIVEWNFDHGARNGKWSWWYPNGDKRLEATYKNGNLDGEVSEWNQGGQLASKTTYVDGKLLDKVVGWYALGQKHFEGFYLRVAHMPEATYDWWKGSIATAAAAPTGEDQKHGTWTEWYRSGNKKTEAQYDHNVAVGKFTWWYENGQKQAEVEYQMGVYNGTFTTWHANGLKESQAEYRNGELVDKWMHWDADGKLVEMRDPSKAAPEGKNNRASPTQAAVPAAQSR